MDNETTLSVPLPSDALPGPDAIIKWPEVRLTVPVKVDVPWRLVDDPILTMPAPELDETTLFEQLYGPVERPRRREDHRMTLGDKVLVVMGAAVIVGAVGICTMVDQGWAVGAIPDDEPLTTVSVPQEPSEQSWEPVTPTRSPKRSYGPVAAPQETVEVRPETVAPQPTKSIVVIPAPEPTPEPSSPPVSTPPPSPMPSPSVTPSKSPSPSPSPSVSTSPVPTTMSPSPPELGSTS